MVEVRQMIWMISMWTQLYGVFFVSVTRKAAVHLGQDKNRLLMSVTLLFQTTERLIKDQVEITGLSTTDSNQPMWGETSLCDGAVHIMNSKTCVLADSVLCPVLNQSKLGKTKLNGIWSGKISQHSLHWQFSLRFKGWLREQFQGKIIFMSMYNDIVWGERAKREFFCEFCQCCSIRSKVHARMLVISGTWLREEVVRDPCQQTRRRMGHDCWKHDAQLCWEQASCISCFQCRGKRRIEKQRNDREKDQLRETCGNEHCIDFRIPCIPHSAVEHFETNRKEKFRQLFETGPCCWCI